MQVEMSVACLHYFVSILSLASLELVAASECFTSDGEGQCESLMASHWHQARTTAASNAPRSYCEHGELYVCPIPDASVGATANSAPENVTVVVSPSTSSRKVLLHVHWESPSDGSIIGYEVLIRSGQAHEINHRICACVNQTTRHAVLTGLDSLVQDSMEVEVRSLPYTHDNIKLKTVKIPLRNVDEATANECLAAAAANYSQCSSNISYDVLPAEDVLRQTRYLPNSTELMAATISWPHLPATGLGVVVILTDPALSAATNCTAPGRDPPCFISREATGVTIQPLNASINYTLNLQRFNATRQPCSDPSPTHLFNGCGTSTCCNSSTLLPPHISSTVQLRPHTTSHDNPESSSPIDYGDSSKTLEDEYRSTASDIQEAATTEVHNGYLVPTVCTVTVGVVTLTVTALLILAFLLKRKYRDSKPPSPPISRGLGAGLKLKYASTDHSTNLLHHQGTSPLLNSTPSPLQSGETKILSFGAPPPSSLTLAQSPLTHSITPTTSSPWQHPETSLQCSSSLHASSEGSPQTSIVPRPQTLQGLTEPHPQALLEPHPQGDTEDSVLIIYSPSITSAEREVILVNLVGGLSQYGVTSHCHDTTSVRSPCEWMEVEITAASAVLCVCTPDFHREWNQSPSDGKIPVVGLLKHLIHATVSRGESLGKFATVLLERSDAGCVPSRYLQGEPRQFLVTELEEIVKFVHNIPSYCTLS